VDDNTGGAIFMELGGEGSDSIIDEICTAEQECRGDGSIIRVFYYDRKPEKS
jgi:hypothetical protein